MLTQDIADEIHTRFTGHIHIAQHQRKGLFLQPCPCLTRIGREDRFIPMGLKHVSQQPADRFFVVDDQNAREFKEGLLGGSVKKQRHEL